MVQEDVTNTYNRNTEYDPAPGDVYWAATKDYWAAVRGLWDEAIARDNGVHVAEVGATGSVTGTPLMNLADDIQTGDITTAAAIEQARAIITEATTAR